MNKKGQLSMYEFKWFFFGLLGGLILTFLVTFLGSRNILPFKIPVICGMAFFNKKGQLGVLLGKFFLFGLIAGIILGLVLIWLGTASILPFQIPVCPVEA